jgi:hypothetical protein
MNVVHNLAPYVVNFTVNIIHTIYKKENVGKVSAYFIALTMDSPMWTQSTAWSGLSRGAPLMQ